MTLPYRQWNKFDVRTIKKSASTVLDNDVAYWTNDHIVGSLIGSYSNTGPIYVEWTTLVKPAAENFELVTSLDEVIDFGFDYIFSLYINTEGTDCAEFYMHWRPMDDPAGGTWDPDLVTGKYYDGANQWDSYPPYVGGYATRDPVTTLHEEADCPVSGLTWIPSYSAGARGNQNMDDFFARGTSWRAPHLGSIGAQACTWGNFYTFWQGFLEPQRVRVNYFNPVVNSVSRTHMKPDGGVEITLTGIGFNMDDNEISSQSRYENNTLRNWDSFVNYIDFIGKQGQGTTTLTGYIPGEWDVPGSDFTVESDTEIVIHSMPALEPGTYEVRLRKAAHNDIAGAPEAYIGDFTADEDGLCHEGSRFSFLVTEEEGIDDPKGTMLYSRWTFKAKDGSQIFQRWAPIDVRSTDRFYDGRLISESNLARSIDDRSGLPNISDMNVKVAVDRELRQLLAQYFIKNQLVSLYFGWMNQPEDWKQNIITMIVDDHDLECDVLNVTLKDISQKYFRVSIPRYLVTLDEYPDAHESAVGQPMPEAVGLCSKTGDPPGAITALYVDTTSFKYLALRGSAHAMTQVYSDGTLQTEGAGNDYTISYEDGGRTYINFNADQGDAKITFNCEGYMFASWNSANGYVQNPAYVIGFLFAFIAEIPVEHIDTAALDDIAEIFEDRGEEESGFWIGQDSQATESAVQELNFTYGAKTWPDREGRFTFDIKDISNFSTDVWIFEQIDALKPSVRKENLREAMNYVKALYGYIPSASAHLGSTEETREAAVDDFEAQIEAADSPWKFPWTRSLTHVETRITDELLKRAYGPKELHFQLAIDWIFDIDIFDSFVYQNPFVPTLSGDGEEQHYYYVSKLAYNFVNNTIDVIGIDLQWLIRQCMIIGRCEDLAESWMDATEAMRMFGYVCTCDVGSGNVNGFPDGEDCKKICKCGG